ncbi:hypothetical protein [Nocardioides sp.]|uniref:hypothetical protein n=1 Tax=Nocardioides sp. TaxID=35761 RepID=UPI002736F2DB|nr:hypothetical protein [Nocardioides sp.]MDP3889814.1 hypothetical protein [Nocardioides sp.]
MNSARPGNIPADRIPAPLTVAASLAAVEGAVFVLYGVMELASVSADRMAVGLTTGAFFVGYGAGLALCAWALYRLGGWARSPVVLAQLLQLGVAWSFRGGDTLVVAVFLAVVSVVVIAGILHPASLAALADDED